MTFTRAIVRTPCSRLADGITTAGLGPVDTGRALAQHRSYCQALEACGLTVEILDPLEDYPDSTFIEDVALCTPRGAVLTRPGAPTRRGEEAHTGPVLEKYFGRLHRIENPATIEAGDIMMVGDRYFIGRTARSNEPGFAQMAAFLESCGYRAISVPVGDLLHLKTGVSYLENNILLATGPLAEENCFSEFDIIRVGEDEAYAANSLWINGKVLCPAGFPKTSAAIRAAGYEVIEVDVSEFRKLDGGLSCLSLRIA